MSRHPLLVPPQVGLWTVESRIRRKGASAYNVRCECGATGIITGARLVNGESKGCLACTGNGKKQGPDGTLDGVGLTHQEIADRLGLSKQRIQQIEKVALEKMRAACRMDWSADD